MSVNNRSDDSMTALMNKSASFFLVLSLGMFSWWLVGFYTKVDKLEARIIEIELRIGRAETSINYNREEIIYNRNRIQGLME